MAEMSTMEKLLVISPFWAWFQRGEINAFIRWGQLDSTACVLDMDVCGVATKRMGEGGAAR